MTLGPAGRAFRILMFVIRPVGSNPVHMLSLHTAEPITLLRVSLFVASPIQSYAWSSNKILIWESLKIAFFNSKFVLLFNHIPNKKGFMDSSIIQIYECISSFILTYWFFENIFISINQSILTSIINSNLVKNDRFGALVYWYTYEYIFHSCYYQIQIINC